MKSRYHADELKTIGASGQPENELWLNTEPARGILAAAIEWAEKNPTQASNLDVLALMLERR